MTLRYISAFATLLSSVCLISTFQDTASAQTAGQVCESTSIIRHTVAPGETLESIAQGYNLKPVTLTNMNPGLQNQVTAGSEILIPPYNGILVQVAPGQTWRQVAAAYKVRPDVLFELNGCQKSPKVVFVPMGNRLPRPSTAPTTTATSTAAKLSGYPLPSVAPVALAYGWQIRPATNQVFFHSGLDLLAVVGTPVRSVADGTVVFAGNQGTYGKLAIVNHSGGLQTRYAHLGSIVVAVGQTVKQGDLLGTVGTSGKPTSLQPHLLFEVRSTSSQGWVAQDPKLYLQK